MKFSLSVLFLCIFSINGWANDLSSSDKWYLDYKGRQIIQQASKELVRDIESTNYFDHFDDYRYRKYDLLYLLNFDHLNLLPNKRGELNGRIVLMLYQGTTRQIDIYQDYFHLFAAVLPSQMQEAVREVKLMLIYEVATSWGSSEHEAHGFAQNLLEYLERPVTRPQRPDEGVFVKSNFCGCEEHSSLTGEACINFCRKQDNETMTLYFSVHLSREVEQLFGNLEHWCNDSIDDNDVSPECFLRVQSENEVRDLAVSISGNSVIAPLQTLKKDIPYTAKLIVTNEQGVAGQSDAFSLLLNKVNLPPVVSHPLTISPISQYICLYTGIPWEMNNFPNPTRGMLHFYFSADDVPPAMPYLGESGPFTYCHDVQTYGPRDSSAYPRFDLRPKYLNLWSKSDTLFYETLQEGKLDVHVLIEQRLKQEYNITTQIRIFDMLGGPSYPLADHNTDQGYYLTAWADPTTGDAYCPTYADYHGDNPVLRVLNDIIGKDTEGLYISKKDPETVDDEDGGNILVPNDYLLIRESLLKKIAFYFEQTSATENVIVPADTNDFKRKTISFFWPADYDESGEPENQYSWSSRKRVYTIVRSSEYIYPNGATTDGSRRDIPTADKRIGCVPIL